VAKLSNTMHINFYQNWSTFAEVMHNSFLFWCFYAPQCSYRNMISNTESYDCSKRFTV